MKRCIALLLACLMILPLAACNGGTDTPDVGNDGTSSDSAPSAASATDASATDTSDTEALETVDPNTVDDLPDTMDFGGLTLGVVSVGSDNGLYTSMLGSEETDATPMDRETYQRNMYLKDRLQIDIGEVIYHYDEMAAQTQALIMANDPSVDMVNWGLWRVFSFGVEGNLLPASAVPHIDQSKAYWASDAQEAMTLLGQQYVLSGDFDTSRYSGTYCILFNQKILTDYSLESPYDLVDRDAWTFDALLRMAQTVQNDADQDGTPTAGDTIGMLGTAHSMFTQFHIAAGLREISPDEDGYPVFRIAGSEAFQNVWEWCGAMYDSGVMMGGGTEQFAEDLALFLTATFGDVQKLSNMESDFGVVPTPKYDENQTRYYSQNGGSGFGVLISTKSPEACGAFLEMGSAYGHANLIPLFYENDLKTRLARDPKCAEMYDLILDSGVFDLGIHAYLNVCSFQFCRGFTDRSALSSLIRKNEKKINAALSDAVTKVEAAKAKS